jgi:hypothetical protein
VRLKAPAVARYFALHQFLTRAFNSYQTSWTGRPGPYISDDPWSGAHIDWNQADSRWSSPQSASRLQAGGYTPLKPSSYKPSGTLMAMNMPETGVSNTLAAVNMSVLANGNAVFDMGANIVGITILSIHGPPNATITIKV